MNKWERRKKLRIIKAKLLRFLGITKPIQLDKYERQWILLCKGHFKDKYGTNAKNWIDSLRPLHAEIYQWGDSRDWYHDFLRCMFDVLLDLHLKIKLDNSGSERQLKEIFNASFSKGLARDNELPIERAISELCGQIQCNQVVENGVARYHLDVDEFKEAA